jgi:peptidoglycan/xylan/chitin deacetylase (PgdA/CDA1 family)
MIPILCYHRIADLPPDHPLRPYSVTPAAFVRHMAHLAAGGFRCVALADVLAETQTPGERCFALTFDDGALDCYEAALPICEAHGFQPTVFLVSDWLEDAGAAPATQRPLLSPAQVLEMRRRGVSFGAHSRTHRRLVDLSAAELRAEICGSKAGLEQLLNEPVTTFAYPFGLSNPTVRKVVATCNYMLAVAVENGSNDRFQLHREPVGNRDTLLSLAWKVSPWSARVRRLRSTVRRASRPLKTDN